jgi:hypothetical protein
MIRYHTYPCVPKICFPPKWPQGAIFPTMRFRSRMKHRDGGVDAPKSGAHIQPRIDDVGAKLQKLLQKIPSCSDDHCIITISIEMRSSEVDSRGGRIRTAHYKQPKEADDQALHTEPGNTQIGWEKKSYKMREKRPEILGTKQSTFIYHIS